MSSVTADQVKQLERCEAGLKVLRGAGVTGMQEGGFFDVFMELHYSRLGVQRAPVKVSSGACDGAVAAFGHMTVLEQHAMQQRGGEY